MRKRKRLKLEAAGWVVGSAEERKRSLASTARLNSPKRAKSISSFDSRGINSDQR